MADQVSERERKILALWLARHALDRTASSVYLFVEETFTTGLRLADHVNAHHQRVMDVIRDSVAE